MSNEEIKCPEGWEAAFSTTRVVFKKEKRAIERTAGAKMWSVCRVGNFGVLIPFARRKTMEAAMEKAEACMNVDDVFLR
jgi:hypothetical protein